MNNGGPGRGRPGFSILTANIQILSLEMPDKNVNFAIILGNTGIWIWGLYAYKIYCKIGFFFCRGHSIAL